MSAQSTLPESCFLHCQAAFGSVPLAPVLGFPHASCLECVHAIEPPSLSEAPTAFALERREDVQWVANALGRALSLAEQALVLLTCAFARRRPYNVHRASGWKARLQPIGHFGARVSVDSGAATTDSDGLTAFVLLAHDLGVRASVQPCGGNRLELQAHLRARKGRLGRRHPSLARVVAGWSSRPNQVRATHVAAPTPPEAHGGAHSFDAASLEVRPPKSAPDCGDAP